MATDSIFTVFADFNEPRDEPASPPDESEHLPAGEIGELRDAAWTEGYMTGRQDAGGGHGRSREAGTDDRDPSLTARLVTSLHELDLHTSEAVDAAALAVADLLVNTVIAITSDTWSARLLDRVRAVADRIKPALTVAPAFVLRDADGTVQDFNDISDLSRALEAGGTGEDVTIRWHRGEATISRMALLEDLQEAIIPLSAGQTSEQNARQQT